jgi:hypothetical protein
MFGKDEIFVGIIIFLFGAFTAFFSLKMPIGTFRMPGTGMFPLLLGILLMVLSSIFILKIFLQSKKILGKSLTSEIQGFPIRLIFFFGTMVFATAFLNKLGYPLISFLLMIALLKTLGNKNWGFIFILSMITAVISYFLFVQWLKIPLPKGWLGL